jgi:hypothetical protein
MYVWLRVPALVFAVFSLAGAQEKQQRTPPVSCTDAKVSYKDYHLPQSALRIERIGRSPRPNGEETKETPQRTRWLAQSQLDTMKPGPWTTTIIAGDRSGAFLKLTFHSNYANPIQSQWLTEKLLFLRLWLGRFMSVDMILDIERVTFVYSQLANYDEIMESCP